MLFISLVTLFAASSLAVKTRTVYEFPNPTWLENIIPTRNNSLLVSVVGRPEMYLVNPNLPTPTASLVTTFPSANAVLGIAKLAEDLFAVGVGSTTPDNRPVPKSFSIWTVDLLPRNKPAKVAKVVDTPDVQLINGLAALDENTVLFADSFSGTILKLDIKTRTYNIVLQDKTLDEDLSKPLPIGVNGIRLKENTLYYSTTVQNLTGKVQLDVKTGRNIAPFQIVAQNKGVQQPDDFAVARDGTLYVASPVVDTLSRVRPDGKVDVLVRGGDVAGATSATFLRGEKTVYLSTSGLVGGVPTRGGRVVAVDL